MRHTPHRNAGHRSAGHRRAGRRGRHAMAALAAGLTLVLGACGSASDDAARTPAKIRIAAGGDATLATAGAGAERAAGADDKMAADAMPSIGMAAPTEWVVEGELPALDGEAAAWVFPADPDVDTADVEKLARALGIEGDVREAPAEEGGGWRVGSADFTGPWLSVDTSGMAGWFYDSAAYARTAVTCGPVTEPAAPDATTAPDGSTATPADGADDAKIAECPEPTPPANVPSADEARAKALDLAKAIGVKVDESTVQVQGDEWGRYVTWSTVLDGVVSPAMWSAAYGAEGELVSASGHLVEPQEAAPYPRIGTAKAVELLRSGAGWFGGPAIALEGDAATSGVASSGAGVAADEPVSSDDTATDPTVTLPVEPMEPFTVTITGVEAALTMLYGVDGEVWLVPAYRFTGPDGEVALVPAIDSSYVEQVVPTGDGTEGGTADAPAPAAGSGAAEPAAPAATKP